MKKVVIEKAKEVICFLVCVGVLAGIAYYTGLLNFVSTDSIKDSFSKFTNTVANPKEIKNSGFNPNGRSVTRYNNVRTYAIPQSVIKAVNNSNQWNDIFFGSRLNVFYVTGKGYFSPHFDSVVKHYVSSSKENRGYFTVKAYDTSRYNAMKNNVDIGPAKICDSIEECAGQANKANAHSTVSAFVDRCAKALCIINTRRSEYVMLRSSNPQKAVDTLESLKGW